MVPAEQIALSFASGSTTLSFAHDRDQRRECFIAFVAAMELGGRVVSVTEPEHLAEVLAFRTRPDLVLVDRVRLSAADLRALESRAGAVIVVEPERPRCVH
jgi:hypothetical protein